MLTIFDFDGTIADTFEAALRIYHELAEENGFRQIQPGELAELRELRAKEVFKRLGIPKLRVPSLLLTGRSRLRADLTTIALNPGMGEVLLALKKRGDRLGILTSNSAENVRLFLDSHGLGEVFEFISSTSKLSGKHKHLRAISKTFSVPAGEIFYVGDEIRDIVAAKKAGNRTIAVAWGFNTPHALEKEEPDHLISDASELLDLLGR